MATSRRPLKEVTHNHKEAALRDFIKYRETRYALMLIKSIQEDESSQTPPFFDRVDRNDRSFLCLALKNGLTEIAHHLLTLQALNKGILLRKDKEGRTLISYAAEKITDENFLRELLGATIALSSQPLFWFTPDRQGKSPLHYATSISNSVAFELLIETINEEKNARELINFTDMKGNSPLHKAKDEQFALQLIRFGADIDITNNDGEKPISGWEDESILFFAQQGIFIGCDLSKETLNILKSNTDTPIFLLGSSHAGELITDNTLIPHSYIDPERAALVFHNLAPQQQEHIHLRCRQLLNSTQSSDVIKKFYILLSEQFGGENNEELIEQETIEEEVINYKLLNEEREFLTHLIYQMTINLDKLQKKADTKTRCALACQAAGNLIAITWAMTVIALETAFILTAMLEYDFEIGVMITAFLMLLAVPLLIVVGIGIGHLFSTYGESFKPTLNVQDWNNLFAFKFNLLEQFKEISKDNTMSKRMKELLNDFINTLEHLNFDESIENTIEAAKKLKIDLKNIREELNRSHQPLSLFFTNKNSIKIETISNTEKISELLPKQLAMT